MKPHEAACKAVVKPGKKEKIRKEENKTKKPKRTKKENPKTTPLKETHHNNTKNPLKPRIPKNHQEDQPDHP